MRTSGKLVCARVRVSKRSLLAFFHSLANRCINLQNRHYKSATNETVKLTARFRENKSARIAGVVVGAIHSVNFSLLAAKIRFHCASPRSRRRLTSGLRSEINLVRSSAIHTYIYRSGDKRRPSGGWCGGGWRAGEKRTEGRRGGWRSGGVRNMKYEGRADGRGEFVRFLSFCNGRWKGRTSTESFVNRPVESRQPDKGETDCVGY